MFISILLSTTSCTQNAVYENVAELDAKGWRKDQWVAFDYNSQDTATRYDIIVDIRNSADYSYKNFWLFVRSTSPDTIVFADTLECVLADNYGNWIGKSTGSLHELPVIMLSDIKFPKKGNYHFEFIQGMREDTLRGIHEIGLRIQEHVQEHAQ